MGADNWTTCPVCERNAKEAKARAVLEADAAYGKVHPNEYLAMKEAASKPVELDSTLREDWDIGIFKGKFSASYTGRCEKCKFKFSFTEEKKLTLPGG